MAAMLGSTKMTTGKIPKLTTVGVNAWLAQLGINGEARIMPPGEHRRFMLLSGGQSLILGMSLNAIHKNEAVRLEPDADVLEDVGSRWMRPVTRTSMRSLQAEGLVMRGKGLCHTRIDEMAAHASSSDERRCR